MALRWTFPPPGIAKEGREVNSSPHLSKAIFCHAPSSEASVAPQAQARCWMWGQTKLQPLPSDMALEDKRWDLEQILRAYVQTAINSVSGYKALLLDKETMRTCSTLVGRSELADSGVVHIERLDASEPLQVHPELKVTCLGAQGARAEAEALHAKNPTLLLLSSFISCPMCRASCT